MPYSDYRQFPDFDYASPCSSGPIFKAFSSGLRASLDLAESKISASAGSSVGPSSVARLYEQISTRTFELPKRTAIFAHSKKTLLSSISLSLRVSRLQIKIMCTRFSGEYLQARTILSADYSPETSSQANGPFQRRWPALSRPLPQDVPPLNVQQ